MRISDWSSDVCSSDLIDIEPREMDSNVEIAAPVVGDIGSCVYALLEGMGDTWAPPPAEWTGTVNEKKEANVAKMPPRHPNNNGAMEYPRQKETRVGKGGVGTVNARLARAR